ncbi:MAG: transcriptional regulator FilR1 domain-containing protein [Methanolobus sp.]
MIGLSTLTFSEDFLLIRLLTEDKLYDPRHLFSYNREAIAWGEELFQHYLELSELLEKL